MMPMPPSRAIAIAERASVTEAIAARTIGMFSSRPRVRRDRTSTSAGPTSLYAGTSMTASNVKHSRGLWASVAGPAAGSEVRQPAPELGRTAHVEPHENGLEFLSIVRRCAELAVVRFSATLCYAPSNGLVARGYRGLPSEARAPLREARGWHATGVHGERAIAGRAARG